MTADSVRGASLIKFAIILAFIALAFAAGKYFQRPIEVGGCDPPTIPAPTGVRYADGQALAGKILALCGLPNNVDVYMEQFPEDGRAQPLYRRIYLSTGNGQLYQDGKIRWQVARVLAHEIGHILNQNDLSGRNGQDEADAFSGWAMRKLGATHEQTMMGIADEKVKAAVEHGWQRE